MSGKLSMGEQARVGSYNSHLDQNKKGRLKATTWFVSRHAGAIEWAKGQCLAIDRWVAHLKPADVEPGDTVIGSLPVNLAAQICERGARYLHVSILVPAEWRGRELSVTEMASCATELIEFEIKRTGENEPL